MILQCAVRAARQSAETAPARTPWPLTHHQCPARRREPGHPRLLRRSASRRRTIWPRNCPSNAP